MAKAEPKAGFGKLVKPAAQTDKFLLQQLMDDEVELGAFICNFDHTLQENSAILFAASRPSDIKPNDFVGQTIDVTYWIAQKMAVPGRGSEAPSIVVRTTVISPEGKAFSCTSKGVAKSIDVLRQTMPDVPWIPPVKLKLLATDIGKGGDFLMLVPVHLAADVAATPLEGA